MKNYYKKIVLILFLILTNVALAQSPTLYPGYPEINKLVTEVIANPIFAKAGPPHVNILTYESTELATGNKFSRYQIHLLENQQQITRYRTREVA